ncbi:MAG: DUF721 domain-containing protein, partial [Nitrospirae bacterium]
MRRRRRGLEPLESLLEKVVGDRRLLEGGGRVGRLARAWPEVVGAPIAAHSRPAALRGAALVVHVDEAAWLTELSYRRGELLARIHAWAGEAWPA